MCPATEVQISPWQLKEAKDTRVYPLQQFLRTQQSFRHQMDNPDNRKIVGDKDHAQKKTRRKRKQIGLLSNVILQYKTQADQLHLAVKKRLLHWKREFQMYSCSTSGETPVLKAGRNPLLKHEQFRKKFTTNRYRRTPSDVESHKSDSIPIRKSRQAWVRTMATRDTV